MAIVFIPAQLQELTAAKQVEVPGRSVREIVAALDERFAGIATRLCDGGQLSPSLQVSVDDVISTRGLDAEVGPRSEIHFLPAIGGG